MQFPSEADEIRSRFPERCGIVTAGAEAAELETAEQEPETGNGRVFASPEHPLYRMFNDNHNEFADHLLRHHSDQVRGAMAAFLLGSVGPDAQLAPAEYQRFFKGMAFAMSWDRMADYDEDECPDEEGPTSV